MMKNRIFFLFGTLYIPEIIKVLLGYEPEYFFATLKGYSVYLGTEDIMPEEIKQDFIDKGRNLTDFKFLFAKKDDSSGAQISGKAYYLTTRDELIIDFWERYPRWYRKEEVTVSGKDKKEYAAMIYTQNAEAEKLSKFEHSPNGIEKPVASAVKLREAINKLYPGIIDLPKK